MAWSPNTQNYNFNQFKQEKLIPFNATNRTKLTAECYVRARQYVPVTRVLLMLICELRVMKRNKQKCILS